MTPDRATRNRGLWLTAYLAYIGLSNAWGAYRVLDRYWVLVSHRAPNIPHWPYLVLGILSVLAIVGVVGIWLWKRWGLFLYVFCWVSALALNIFLGTPIWTHFMSLANVVLLYALLRPKWNLLR